MITLLQNSENLIGSQKDINELASLDHARILVISDSHGNFRILKTILERYGPDCNAFVFCGDGARDIAEILEIANEDEEFRKCIPPVMAIVRGNGDPDYYPVCYEIGKNNSQAQDYPKGAVLFPLEQTLTVNGMSFFITHGHYEGVDFGRENLGFKAVVSGCKAAFYGHTHIAKEENSKGFKFVNPGSCSRPRGGQPGSFAIVTVEKKFTDTAFIQTNDFKLWTPIG